MAIALTGKVFIAIAAAIGTLTGAALGMRHVWVEYDPLFPAAKWYVNERADRVLLDAKAEVARRDARIAVLERDAIDARITAADSKRVSLGRDRLEWGKKLIDGMDAGYRGLVEDRIRGIDDEIRVLESRTIPKLLEDRERLVH